MERHIMKKTLKHIICLVVFVAIVFGCMTVANIIQTDNGKVEITEGTISGVSWNGFEAKDVYFRLYKPQTATAANKAPAVLLLHGYQNDNQTCAFYAVELARRGYVVMAIDEYGHGKTTNTSLIDRGYVNHKVTVNFGTDSEEAGTFVSTSGPIRYRVMMNFSNLSFFNEKYTTDDDGNKLTDSSAGGVLAYAVLGSYDFVDNQKMAISGHSMGTWSSWTVAAAYSGSEIEPKATVLQCGELFTGDAYDQGIYHFNNVLLLQAKWDEFSYFRDYKNVVNDDLLKSPIRTEFLGVGADEAAWNTTFGHFEDGTARRIELLYTNHRLTTHHSDGLATAIDWFDAATGYTSPIKSTDQVAMIKEVLGLVAMLAAIASMIPLMELLLLLPFLKGAAQPLPSVEKAKTNKKWWKGAVITMLIAASTYPFMTQLGHGLLPLPETNIFRMTIGNGFLSWYLLLIVIMLVMTIVSQVRGKKKGTAQSYHDMGIGTAANPDKFGWGLLARSLVLMVLMLGFMYLLVAICTLAFKLDFRFIWPFFATYNLTRFGQFFVYFPVFALFFILNNSKIMASARTAATYESGFKGFIKTWWRIAMMMAGGIVILVLIEYIPFFANIGPGADLLFSSTFGGPFMSLLIVFLPQVLVFSVLGTYIYRRTGNAFQSALVIAGLACWVVTSGSSML